MARRRSTGGRTIDYKAWGKIIHTDVSLSTDTTIISGFTSFSDSLTILRTRGYVQALLDATKQVGDGIVLTFGLGIVSTDAATLGATAVPDPGSDFDYPWLWWGEMTLSAEATLGADTWGPHAQRLEVDSKAMRRVTPKQSILWVCQSSAATGAPVTLVTFGSTRILLGT